MPARNLNLFHEEKLKAHLV